MASQWLIEDARVDVNAKNNIGSTALHEAAYYNDIEIAKLLLKNNAQHVKNQSGETPLDLAKKRGCKELANILEFHFSN